MTLAPVEQEPPDLDNIIKITIPKIRLFLPETCHLPFPKATSHLELFRETDRAAKEVDLRYAQNEAFFFQVVGRANGFPKSPCPERVTYVEANAEMALLPVDHLRHQMRQALRATTKAMVRSVFVACQQCVISQEMGLIRWLAEAVCRYFFFRQRTSKQTLGRHDMGRTIRSDYEFVTTHSIHIHDLIEAKKTPAKQFRGELPKRIANVIAKIPPWLEPLIDVVSGHQISATTVEREVGRKAWSEFTPKPQPIVRFDPCLILGPFVLCGWEEGER